MSQVGGEATEGKEGPSSGWSARWETGPGFCVVGEGGGSPGHQVAHFSEFCGTGKAFKSSKRAL